MPTKELFKGLLYFSKLISILMKSILLFLADFNAFKSCKDGVKVVRVDFIEKSLPELCDEEGRRTCGLEVSDVFQNLYLVFDNLVVIFKEKIPTYFDFVCKCVVVDLKFDVLTHNERKSDPHEMRDHCEVILFTGSDHRLIVP